MLTPLDIQNKSFSNATMGYKKAEVDAFKEEILSEYETLYKSYNEANSKIKELTKALETYTAMEETMKNTLVVAQSSAEKLTEASQKDAEAIINEATVKSQEIISKANDRIASLTAEYEALKKEIGMFIMRAKSEFDVQIKSLEQSQERLEKSGV